MPLPASPNAISLDAIQTEFGGSAPTSISEYYRGTIGVALVPNISVNNNVPTGSAGVQISFSNFHSAEQIDYVPNSININNVTAIGSGFASADSNQITITGINTSITLSFRTSDAYAVGYDPDPNETGDETDAFLSLDIIVNGSLVNQVSWGSSGGGYSSGFGTLEADVTVSNNDTVKVILGISASGQGPVSGGATFAIINESSGNAQLDTFDVYGQA